MSVLSVCLCLIFLVALDRCYHGNGASSNEVNAVSKQRALPQGQVGPMGLFECLLRHFCRLSAYSVWQGGGAHGELLGHQIVNFLVCRKQSCWIFHGSDLPQYGIDSITTQGGWVLLKTYTKKYLVCPVATPKDCARWPIKKDWPLAGLAHLKDINQVEAK